MIAHYLFSFNHQILRSAMLKSIILVLCSNASGVAQDQEHFDLSNEHLGKIQLGDKIEEVMKEIGPPAESTRQFEDPMNDCIKQLYFYQSGLEVETCKNNTSPPIAAKFYHLY